MRGWADISLLKTVSCDTQLIVLILVADLPFSTNSRDASTRKTLSTLTRSSPPCSPENLAQRTTKVASPTNNLLSKPSFSSLLKYHVPITPPSRAFQTFGSFTSGIGVHYAPSSITNTTHQSHASSLTIGQRILPHVFVRAADGRPYEIQDLLPFDTRFKILVFAGDTSNESQNDRVKALAEQFSSADGFYHRYGGKNPSKIFEILAISPLPKDSIAYTDIPEVFRSHWSKCVPRLVLQ